MRKLLLSLLSALAILTLLMSGPAVSKEANDMLENIHWLGHDTFLVTGEKTIYTDPFQITGSGPQADIVLITHEHRDHCSPDDVARISGPGTVIVTTPDCVEKLRGVKKKEVLTVRPGESLKAAGIELKAVHAYNTNKKFHPRENGWVGFIFSSGGVRYYLAGDTDHIPEMKDFRCDVALLPVSGTYVMTADEAAKAALDIKPAVAVPMHYGAIVGEPSDAERFASLLKGKVEVRVLGKE